jgi:hypothetical protein
MNIRDLIDEKKRKFRELQSSNKQKTIVRETNRVREDNLRRSEVVGRQNELNEAKQINQDLRQAQGPSNLQKFGQGLAKVMNKTSIGGGNKANPKIAKKTGSRLGQINQGSTGLQMGGASQGSPFGGQRNIEVGGGSNNSPFSGGSRGLEFGRQAPARPQPPRPKMKTVFRY